MLQSPAAASAVVWACQILTHIRFHVSEPQTVLLSSRESAAREVPEARAGAGARADWRDFDRQTVKGEAREEGWP